MDDARDARRKKQTNEIYQAIGRFVVGFEHVCRAMSQTILFALEHRGLRDQQLGRAVLSDLTAAPLRKVFVAVLAEFYRSDPESVKNVQHISKRVQELIEIRNRIIHSTWMVGWASLEDQDFSTVHGFKSKNSNSGTWADGSDRTATDFDTDTARATELAELCGQLGLCVMAGFRPADHFNVDANGMIRPGPKNAMDTP